MKRHLVMVTCVLLWAWAGTAWAGVIHVPAQYAEIHDAVQACDPGDTVLVAAGNYQDCTHETEGPGSTPACVIMKSGVTLIGSGPNQTIIDAGQVPPDGDGRGIFIENVTNCRVENLQVRGAFAETYGAGILIRHVDHSVALSDLLVTANLDGGIICIDEGSPILSRIDMITNEGKQGGGLSIEEQSHPAVLNCLIDNNVAPLAAGLMIRNSSPFIRSCVIQNNVSTGGSGVGAGGIMVSTGSPEITDCQILDNQSIGHGGGIAYQGGGGGELTYSTIRGNTCTGDFHFGGGLYSDGTEALIRRVFIVENSTTGFGSDGGGVNCAFTPNATFEQCTIADNTVPATSTIGGVYCSLLGDPIIDKCIIAFSSQGSGLGCEEGSFAANPTVSCTDIFGNAGGDDLCGTDGGGNFSDDPMFCGTAGTEYYLQTGSPCAPGGVAGCDGDQIGAGPVGCGPSGVSNAPEALARLVGNSPNPFNPMTSIFFVLDAPGPATLRIIDLSGRLVRTYAWDQLPVGEHQVVWNGKNQVGRDMASGTYLYQLQAHGSRLSQGMSLIR